MICHRTSLERSHAAAATRRAGLAALALALAGCGAAFAQEDLAAARRRIEQMTPEQREQLFGKQQRFEGLSPDQREQLRRFHEQLARQPDRERLQGVMERYHAWMARLSPLERQRLERLPPRQRMTEIEGMRRRQLQEQRFFHLPPEDRQKVVEFLRRRIDSGSWYEAGWLEQWDRRKRMPEVLAQQFPRDERPEGLPPRAGSDPRRGRRPDQSFFRDMDALFQELTPETQRRWEALTPSQKIDAMRGWLRQGMREMAPSEQELENFFSTELSDERRERLLELPPDEMLHELRRLYVQKQRPPRGDFRGGPPRDEVEPRGPRRRRPEGPPGNGAAEQGRPTGPRLPMR